MKKICEMCGYEFEVLTEKQFKNKRCCTQSCSNKLQWKENRKLMLSASNSKSAKEKKAKAAKLMWKNDDIRNSIIEKIKINANKKETKEIFKKRLKKWRNNNENEYLKMRKEVANTSTFKEKISNSQKQLWTDENYKKTQIEKFKKAQERSWENVEIASKRLNGGFNYKEFKLPSGKIIKVQGYEPQAIRKLLETYKEDELIIGVKNIKKEIGLIKYIFEEKESIYYPDIFIKSENKIIEVKSKWTFEKQKRRNLAKQKACIEQGFNFEFKIIALK